MVVANRPRSRLEGTDGDDIICGLDDDDELHGWHGDDILYGGPGHDVLAGYADDDELHGGPGQDLLVGGYYGTGWLPPKAAPTPTAWRAAPAAT